MAWKDREQTYELHLARRDGRKIRNGPRPVTETFVLNDPEQRDKVVGKHFVYMAAAAEDRTVKPFQKVSDFHKWLPDYQIEIWHEKDRYDPVMVSTSTRGWPD